jgi:hypothetical protein
MLNNSTSNPNNSSYVINDGNKPLFVVSCPEFSNSTKSPSFPNGESVSMTTVDYQFSEEECKAIAFRGYFDENSIKSFASDKLIVESSSDPQSKTGGSVYEEKELVYLLPNSSVDDGSLPQQRSLFESDTELSRSCLDAIQLLAYNIVQHLNQGLKISVKINFSGSQEEEFALDNAIVSAIRKYSSTLTSNDVSWCRQMQN